ncbi:MAG: FIST N-terminal domain-containing protein [Hyphomicrobium sp.]
MAHATAAPAAPCGLLVAASPSGDTAVAVSEVLASLAGAEIQHLVVYFAPLHDARRLSDALAVAFPGVPVSGCSTAGEIAPAGMMQGGLVVIGFPRSGFRVVSEVIENVGQHGVERANVIVRRMKAALVGREERSLAGRLFALMLVDGLSNAEERLVAAVNWAIDDVQLVGGSAGDGLSFDQTVLIHGTTVHRRAAIIVMVESDIPFRVFKSENFEPTPIKLVVTSADTESRIVHELNAEPAAREYAAAIGLLPDDLGPFSFASYPLVVKIGGDYYCRSIRNMNPDGSLSFFCAIDEGLVFTVARPQDIVSATARTLGEIDTALGGIDMVLGFDCVLRRLDAENRQIRHELDALYRQYRVVGFHTYGEQYNAMHLNQTLTGIAFGRKEASP